MWADDPWVRSAAERVAVRPGEAVAVPFRVDLEDGAFGPVASAIRLEGRSVRHAVAVRAVARRVDSSAITSAPVGHVRDSIDMLLIRAGWIPHSRKLSTMATRAKSSSGLKFTSAVMIARR